jgi:hypothetical protein
MTPQNKALEQASQDVPADSSPAPDDTQTPNPDGSTPPGPDAGNQSGDEPKGKKGERGINEVRGELNRKLDKTNADLRAELAEMKGMLQGLATAAPSPAPIQPRTLTDYTAAELEALRPQAKPEELPQLDRMIQSKQVQEAVRAGVQEELGSRDFEDQRTMANRQAYERFPDLYNKTGAFYRETNKVLNEMGKTATSSPRAVLDAANEAGARLGLSPKAGSILLHQHDPIGSGTAPAPESKKQYGLSKEKRQEIARKLQGAMPKGKFTEENLGNIDKNAKLYDEHRDMFIKK